MDTTLQNRTVAPVGQAPAARSSRIATAGAWVLQLGLAGMFLFAGGLKLAGAEPMVQLFDALGVGQWFRYATGGIEVVAAVLLLVPRLAVIGALLLIPTMVGAVATHAFIVGGSAAMPALLGVVAAAIVWLRRRDLVTLIARD